MTIYNRGKILNISNTEKTIKTEYPPKGGAGLVNSMINSAKLFDGCLNEEALEYSIDISCVDVPTPTLTPSRRNPFDEPDYSSSTSNI